ncbi:MAG: phosphoglycerate mutase family protein [Chloroflexi bacterium]|nr:phosphoglycerate mutase family protein [Chloroflexota bacterium]MCI0575157.1 phosphoglycerate mutase family protein [Chloroflexota bacterium]MCI0647161.1 phosphoglycerate mutase family protein [Chloroflexota bacterium]MCI0729963.1 phosphoglycerate mutase family protein [Chloroflexota bacterium]
MQTAWLIRHGQSEGNLGLATLDPASNPLTAAGWEQAGQVSAAFSQPPSLIVTSAYRRSQQTAEPTRQRFPAAPHEEWPVHEYTYLSPLLCRNTTPEQRRPLSDDYWQRCDPFYRHGEDAECFADFMERVAYLLTALSRREERFITIFGHGMFFRAVLWRLLRGPVELSSEAMRQFRAFEGSFDIPNGAIIKVEMHNGELLFSGVITRHLSLGASVC